MCRLVKFSASRVFLQFLMSFPINLLGFQALQFELYIGLRRFKVSCTFSSKDFIKVHASKMGTSIMISFS